MFHQIDPCQLNLKFHVRGYVVSKVLMLHQIDPCQLSLKFHVRGYVVSKVLMFHQIEAGNNINNKNYNLY
jgi:hypothetical protein